MVASDKMTPLERRATASLALVFALRMFGMFSILPVLALYAKDLPGGNSPLLIGIALGIDGLAQACLQIPMGLLSDRIGRKPVIYAGLTFFCVGSLIAASATDLHMIIIGRLVQGLGAVSAPIIALMADVTREEHRAKAMATIGMSIGLSFGISMVLGPALNHLLGGVPGLFALTAVLALASMLVVRFVLPSPAVSRVHADAETVPGQIRAVLWNTELQRLNFGIFSLHGALRGLFVVIPAVLVNVGGLTSAEHWKVYLPVIGISFILAIPGIIVGERYGKLKPVFCGAVALLCISTLLLAVFIGNFIGILAALFLFFLAFNLLEATLPSLVSKIAPAGSKGTAVGVYNTFQFLGLFLGGTLGGFLVQHVGPAAVFVFSAGITLAWLMLAVSMTPPPAVRTRLMHAGEMDAAAAADLATALRALDGVVEVAVDGVEGVAYLKVRMGQWDEAGAIRLMNKRSE